MSSILYSDTNKDAEIIDDEPDYPPYTVSTHPVSQLIVHPAPASRLVNSEHMLPVEVIGLAKKQFVGMKKVLCEMWMLLGRRSEITCSIIHVDGLYRARRINEYVWLVRKLRMIAVEGTSAPAIYDAHYSPYYMIIPDDLVLERDDPPNLNMAGVDKQQKT